MNGEEKSGEKFFAVEDGITFLSRKELDAYREQKVMIAYESGSYA